MKNHSLIFILFVLANIIHAQEAHKTEESKLSIIKRLEILEKRTEDLEKEISHKLASIGFLAETSLTSHFERRSTGPENPQRFDIEDMNTEFTVRTTSNVVFQLYIVSNQTMWSIGLQLFKKENDKWAFVPNTKGDNNLNILGVTNPHSSTSGLAPGIGIVVVRLDPGIYMARLKLVLWNNSVPFVISGSDPRSLIIFGFPCPK